MENQELIDEIVSVLKQVAHAGHEAGGNYHRGVGEAFNPHWEDCGWTSCQIAQDVVEKVAKAEQDPIVFPIAKPIPLYQHTCDEGSVVVTDGDGNVVDINDFEKV